MRRSVAMVLAVTVLAGNSGAGEEPAEGANLSPVLERWRNAKIAPVWSGADRHSLHAYFVHTPESPDGKYVLFYTSGDADGGTGDIRIVERATKKERIVARNITVEDAHRGACQQWSNGGKTVVYHDCRGGRWFVIAVDVETLRETILAEDHQVGFGQANLQWVPIYGCHWNPGPYRDLEFVHVETRQRKTVAKIGDIAKKCEPWLSKMFGEKPVSAFFPVLSPDGSKVFFKIASGYGGDNFRSKGASVREGKVVYDMNGTFLRLFQSWGHPAWHPDSQGILEKGNVVFNVASGQGRALVKTPSDHPSFSPDGQLFTSDADISRRTFGAANEWGIVVATAHAPAYVLVDKFVNTEGAKSWRKNHPHPAFSPDGKRLYYNVNRGPWTTLHVAEAGE